MPQRPPSQETQARPLSGYLMFLVLLALLAGAFVAFGKSAALEARATGNALTWGLAGLGALLAAVLVMPGLFVVAPNMARVLVLFGRYRGTVREPGWWWTNPFTSKGKQTLRARNLNGQQLKVNDLAGNPIEIAAVVVWRVHDTAQAAFDVENVEHYVQVQSESALRHLASRHPYDDGQVVDVTTSLRGSGEEVSKELQAELAERLGRAGVEVLEARLSHLAYAPEIAGAMLQRQQAAAVIAARRRIVEGAVGMVEHALEMLAEKKVVDLDPERRAAMVGNLLVVLCSHSNPAPVLNTGSLYG